MKKFTKNDSGFTCINCGKVVPPLKISSRDHCSNCLHSIHVDIYPGDRANSCKGILKPVAIENNPKKGYVIVFSCEKCNAQVRNKTAPDDDYEEVLKICRKKQ